MPPTDPGRPPHMLGAPDPAAMRIAEPPAIMKRRPTPGIVGLPIPAAIRVQPAAAITVRPPIVIHDADSRLPATAITVDKDPGAVGRKGIVEITAVILQRR